MRTRERNLVLKLDDTELAQIHALADANDEPVARLVRRWVARFYGESFGDKPPPKPKTKHAR